MCLFDNFLKGYTFIDHKLCFKKPVLNTLPFYFNFSEEEQIQSAVLNRSKNKITVRAQYVPVSDGLKDLLEKGYRYDDSNSIYGSYEMPEQHPFKLRFESSSIHQYSIQQDVSFKLHHIRGSFSSRRSSVSFWQLIKKPSLLSTENTESICIWNSTLLNDSPRIHYVVSMNEYTRVAMQQPEIYEVSKLHLRYGSHRDSILARTESYTPIQINNENCILKKLIADEEYLYKYGSKLWTARLDRSVLAGGNQIYMLETNSRREFFVAANNSGINELIKIKNILIK